MDFHILPHTTNTQPKEKITLLRIFSFRCNPILRDTSYGELYLFIV